MHIELVDRPVQHHIPKPLKLSEAEIAAADEQIKILLEKKAIVHTVREPGDFIRNVFLTLKCGGRYRMILNLKPFNQFVKYVHFIMETLNHILAAITPGCWMAIFDFINAYLTISISSKHVCFVKFQWKGKIYMYVVLPFGIGSAPHKFTKVLKPILSFLWCQGIIVLTYIDDGFTTVLTYEQCYNNICHIILTSSAFGFILHKLKSAPLPSHQVRSISFHLNSITMHITLPADKISNAISLASAVLIACDLTVFHIAQVIGTFVSLFPACPLGLAHYRGLESLKVKMLTFNKGSYSASCVLDSSSVQDIQWWLQNLPHTAAPIACPPPSDILFTDSTDKSWGAWFQGQYAQSHFTIEEQDNIIAVKGLYAVLFGLHSFFKYFTGNHILIRCDNVGAVAYVCDMEGMCNSIMNQIAKDIWDFAASDGIWLSITYIKSSDNFHADLASRILNDRTEWALPQILFDRLTTVFF